MRGCRNYDTSWSTEFSLLRLISQNLALSLNSFFSLKISSEDGRKKKTQKSFFFFCGNRLQQGTICAHKVLRAHDSLCKSETKQCLHVCLYFNLSKKVDEPVKLYFNLGPHYEDILVSFRISKSRTRQILKILAGLSWTAACSLFFGKASIYCDLYLFIYLTFFLFLTAAPPRQQDDGAQTPQKQHGLQRRLVRLLRGRKKKRCLCWRLDGHWREEALSGSEMWQF